MISSSRAVPLMETWREAGVQDGESVDHGSSVLPVRFFSINKCLQVRKWVVSHL